MRDASGEIESRAARVVSIGMGTPAQAADFKRRSSLPFTLLVDKDRATYRAVGLERSVRKTVGPQVWAKGLASIARGNLLSPARQDFMQLGATVVVAPGGTVQFFHRARDASDNAPLDAILRALP